VPEKKYNAIMAMGVVINKNFIDILGQIIVDEKNTALKNEALKSISKYNTPAAKNYMSKAFLDRSSKIKITALGCIKNDNDNDIVKLITPLLYDPDTNVQVAAVTALAMNGSDMAVLPLINKLKDPQNSNLIIDRITEALTKTGSINTSKYFLDALASPQQFVRYAALKATINAKNANWIDKIIEDATQNDMNEIRNMAIFALRDTESQKGQSQLYSSINNGDNTERITAIAAFAGTPDAINNEAVFKKLLNDANPLIRNATITSLGKIKAEWALKLLIKQSSTEDETEAALAIKALSNFRTNTEIIPVLASCLIDSRESVAEASAQALVLIGTPKAKQVFVEALSNSSAKVRLRAIKKLSIIGEYTSYGALQRFINDPDPEVSKAAKQATAILMKRKNLNDEIQKHW
jgi:HEAT repeat protein